MCRGKERSGGEVRYGGEAWRSDFGGSSGVEVKGGDDKIGSNRTG